LYKKLPFGIHESEMADIIFMLSNEEKIKAQEMNFYITVNLMKVE
jgi:hypothetical protein